MSKKQTQTSSNKNKKYKGLIAGLAAICVAGITASVTAPLVILANNKGGGSTPVTPEEQKSHSITITQPTGWTITSTKSSAKKGDTVQFSVVKSSSNTQTTIPSAIVIKDSSYDLTKKTNTETYQTKEIVWPYIEEVTVQLSTKTESSSTVGVIFDIGSGTLVSGSLNDTKLKGSKLSESNVPSISAPTNQTFLGWSTDGQTVLSDYTFNADTTLKAVYADKITPAITHKIVFIADKDEKVTSGDRTLTISNGAKWSEVKAMSNFPKITKTGYSIGSYYLYDGTESEELTDNKTFSYTSDTTLIVNISWTTAVYTITFTNTDKTSFATGETGIRTANDGTSWESVSKPVVMGSEDTTTHKRYVPTGKWYTDSSLTNEFTGSITENKTLYAGYDVATTEYKYTVNFVNAYGFAEGATTSETKTVEGNYKFSDFTAPTDKLIYPDQKSSSESAYSFKGWGIEDSTTIPEGTTNVYAQWEVKEVKYYTVVFTSDEQVAWSGSQSFWFETTDTTKTTVGSLSYATPTKTGSTLVGWKYSIDGSTWKEVTGADWQTTFAALKFADIMKEDGTITFVPIFEADSSKHVLYIISNDTAKGTVTANEGFSLLSYVDDTTTIATIKTKITTTPASGYKASKYRNGATGTYFSDSDEITTDTVLVVDFMEDEGGFQGKDWSEVKAACDTFESITSPTVDDAKTLCSALGVDASKSEKTTAKEVLEENLVSKTGTIRVNGVEHLIRCIGAMHDTITGSTNSAALTFEFANLISDANGNSLTTTWDGDGYASGINYDYLNSNVFYNLEHLTPTTASTSARTTTYNDYSYGKGNWYQKAGTAPTTDTAYANKSVYQMLPETLTNGIKQVQKTVATSSSKTASGYALENYNCKLFLPTYREMTASGISTYQKEEGSAYAYYTGTYDSELGRIKKQVSADVLYVSTATATGAGSTASSRKLNIYNYAGYNAQAGSTCGGRCWLASPRLSYNSYAWGCNSDGNFDYNSLGYIYAYGVAPCFCI